ncbi:receptor-interacting serine/threonine-protein kinase 2-like isoform X2 [Pogoniulus pusillus]|uniref:receptor-interacting serine/threonine-protein kinase 2-like isoform X2 n=1 Tax=Pogoniulus pusillus TaxID=488313 RepID=UPI0030B97E80
MAKSLPTVAQADLDSFTLTRMGSGFALKAFHFSWNTHISIKLLTSQDTTEREWKLLLQDIASIKRYESERLLAPLGIYQYQGLVGIVTEWMNNGSLHSLIHEHQLYPELPFPLLIRILSDVAEGLHQLHSLEPACCHGSLKPSNVLLDMQYRAKISDYGLTNWRKQKLRSDLQNCNQRNCCDLVYLPPEIIEGGLPSQEADIYSFGLLCWESLSRQKPFEGQATLLEVLTGICSGVRPSLSEKFISSDLPERNKLLHLIALCWHQEPNCRPCSAECADLLTGIVASINKEAISSAIYNVMDAKETALNACKGSAIYTLQTGMCNSEVICPQKPKHLISKKIPCMVPSLPSILLDSSAYNAGRENTVPQNSTTKKDHPGLNSRKPTSFCTVPAPCLAAGKESSQLKDKPQPRHPDKAVTEQSFLICVEPSHFA